MQSSSNFHNIFIVTMSFATRRQDIVTNQRSVRNFAPREAKDNARLTFSPSIPIHPPPSFLSLSIPLPES